MITTDAFTDALAKKRNGRLSDALASYAKAPPCDSIQVGGAPGGTDCAHQRWRYVSCDIKHKIPLGSSGGREQGPLIAMVHCLRFSCPASSWFTNSQPVVNQNSGLKPPPGFHTIWHFLQSRLSHIRGRIRERERERGREPPVSETRRIVIKPR